MSEPMTEMTDFARPTPEHIAELFKIHDVLPRQDIFLEKPWDDVPKCAACAVGILLVERQGGVAGAFACRDAHPDFLGYDSLLRRATGWPFDFVSGLDDGFTNSDEDDEDDYLDGESPLYREGFAIGWKAWQLVKSRP